MANFTSVYNIRKKKRLKWKLKAKSAKLKWKNWKSKKDKTKL